MTADRLIGKLELLQLCCESHDERYGCGECPYRAECDEDRVHATVVEEVKAILSSEGAAKTIETPDSTVENDPVNHPSHYCFSNGAEVIDITENLNFCRGNAVKYLCRAGRKLDELEDLKKAQFYINREIARLERANG